MNQVQVEVIDSTELAKRLNVPETWVRSRTNTKSNPAFPAWTLYPLSVG
jgi:hypothetical protein